MGELRIPINHDITEAGQRRCRITSSRCPDSLLCPCPGPPCVRIDCLAPPNPACPHVLGLNGGPGCDGVRVPDWWKPCLRSPGCWLSSPAPCHHRLLYN